MNTFFTLAGAALAVWYLIVTPVGLIACLFIRPRRHRNGRNFQAPWLRR